MVEAEISRESDAPAECAARSRECVGAALRDGRLDLWPHCFGTAEADRLYSALRRSLEWQQERLVIYGREHPVPRLVAWYGDPGARYRYSGVEHRPLPWTAELREIRARIVELTGVAYNSVLANLYRNGRDGMGWHADDERELGRDPNIASLSLGATRRFRLRHRASGETHALDLTHGSLLVMSGALQHHWVHCVPKTQRPVGARINLTFREIRACGDATH